MRSLDRDGRRLAVAARAAARAACRDRTGRTSRRSGDCGRIVHSASARNGREALLDLHLHARLAVRRQVDVARPARPRRRRSSRPGRGSGSRRCRRARRRGRSACSPPRAEQHQQRRTPAPIASDEQRRASSRACPPRRRRRRRARRTGSTRRRRGCVAGARAARDRRSVRKPARPPLLGRARARAMPSPVSVDARALERDPRVVAVRVVVAAGGAAEAVSRPPTRSGA